MLHHVEVLVIKKRLPQIYQILREYMADIQVKLISSRQSKKKTHFMDLIVFHFTSIQNIMDIAIHNCKLSTYSSKAASKHQFRINFRTMIKYDSVSKTKNHTAGAIVL